MIRVERTCFTEETTTGKLYVDDKWECYSLEDPVRTATPKVWGHTAIPYGKYEVIIDYSEHLKAYTPHLINVPMFTGVRVHWGNYARDTEGCILVGQTIAQDFVGNSKAAYGVLLTKLQDMLKLGKVYVQVGIVGSVAGGMS